jgi:arylsulfatase A-like enzyme
MTMDWSRTLLEIGGAQPKEQFPPDGVSIKDVLMKPARLFDRPLYWRMNYRTQRAYRSGEWKYSSIEGNEYLFNLEQDSRERANLARRHPDRLSDMRQAWEKWELSVPAIPDDAVVSVGFDERDMPSR